MSNEYEKMIGGKLYNPTDKELDKIHMRGLKLCHRYNQISIGRSNAKKKTLTKLIPSSKGKNLCVYSPMYCEYGININVGENCFLNYNCVLLDVAPITLEDSVWIGANVNIVTPMHPFVAEERINANYPDGFHDLEYAKPITIKKNCWICSGVTICGGVTIGESTIIAAGAVVTQDIPSNCIAGGIPAKVIRMINDKDRLSVWETYFGEKNPISQRERSKTK